MKRPWSVLVILAYWVAAAHAAESAKLTGELKQWHKITLSFDGPEASESSGDGRERNSSFRDSRLDVSFAHAASGRPVVVPGYFAADGNAGETSASAGHVWRVHFMPDATGRWTWKASFRNGRDAALNDAVTGSQPGVFDGATGSFEIGPTEKTGRDFRSEGRLDYVGEHYLKFAGSGKYFIKGGADSPENFLAYFEFDGTRKQIMTDKPRNGEAFTQQLHQYAPHARDWRDGDPTWRGSKGKNIIGALNYLAGKGMNSVYFLTMNVNGDGKDVWPWVSETNYFAFDCSKLDQWEIVFSHMTKLGLAMHVILTETENCKLLDGGELGPARKLYYRELIARFAHQPALVWNLGEENANTDAQRKAFAAYIRKLDPYKHPIVVHTFPPEKEKVYAPLLGFEALEGLSLQNGNQKETHAETIKWIDRSAAAKRPWFVCLDEIGPSHTGVKPDADDPEHDEVRWQSLWGNLMAGGAGAEWYFGYRFAHNDLNCEDWRSRDRLWDQTRHALDFFHRYLPFWQMKHSDELTSAPDDFCFAKPGEIYAVYLPTGGTTELDLGTAQDAFAIKWFNPRQGGELADGSIKSAKGPGKTAIGRPPSQADKDWVALVKRETAK